MVRRRCRSWHSWIQPSFPPTLPVLSSSQNEKNGVPRKHEKIVGIVGKNKKVWLTAHAAAWVPKFGTPWTMAKHRLPNLPLGTDSQQASPSVLLDWGRLFFTIFLGCNPCLFRPCRDRVGDIDFLFRARICYIFSTSRCVRLVVCVWVHGVALPVQPHVQRYHHGGALLPRKAIKALIWAAAAIRGGNERANSYGQ
jgi:hypothetical protein